MEVEDALSEGVLAERFGEGDSVTVDVQDGELVFRAEATQETKSDAKKKALPVLNDCAEKYSVCVVAGSVPEAVSGKNKFYNTSFVLNGRKKSVTKYRKIHLFKAAPPGAQAYTG